MERFRDFPGILLGNVRADPKNSHSLLEFSELKLKSEARLVWKEGPARTKP